ncbi:MAG: type II toxin-antitoxin system RelE/ParE family toxin [Euryarchaeota archaeon]|nr:type II toxin-antitoxin system RelE/ParE family toxin [Euryarchaeota archaeon]
MQIEMYAIFLSEETVKILRKLDKGTEKRIRSKIKKLKKSPYSFGKHLRGIDLWSLRSGKYRILFEIDSKEKKVFIVTLGYRKDVYRELKGKK